MITGKYERGKTTDCSQGMKNSSVGSNASKTTPLTLIFCCFRPVDAQDYHVTFT